MTNNRIREAYLEGEVLQADPVELVRMLNQAALASLGQARVQLEAGNAAERSRHITRASAILSELALSLDHEHGGAIARNLVELYDYLQRLLIDGNSRQADPPLAEAQRLLSVLVDAWQQVSQKAFAGQVVPRESPHCSTSMTF